MKHAFSVAIGPVGFRLGSDWRGPVAALEQLYAGYPRPRDGIADFTVRLFANRPWRRVFRPKVMIGGDFVLPEAAPLSREPGVRAAVLAIHGRGAGRPRRYLLLHASAVERDGKALVMTGLSGAGKSTLAALLMTRGWRLMGDEFALVDPATGMVHAFPRLISLKNEAIGVMQAAAPGARFGPLLADTPKGAIRHLVPDDRSIAAMLEPARPAMILFPTYGHDSAVREVAPSEVFVRLTQASTNYVALAERGFTALTRLVGATPARAIDYPDTDSAMAQVEALWAAL